MQRHLDELDQALNQQLQSSLSVQQQLNDQLQVKHEENQKLQQALDALQVEFAAIRNGLSWRLTAPLRTVASRLYKPRGTGYTYVLADYPVAALVSNSKAESASPGNKESAFNRPQSEISNMKSNPAIQDTQLTVSSPAPNLKALLQLHDQQFVKCAYLTLLRRQPDAEGFNYYLDRVRAGVPKIQILGQFLDSLEARANGVKLPGLREAVKRQKLARLPLFGIFIKHFIVVDGDSEFEIRLRTIEQQIFALGQQSDFRHSQLERGIEGLRKLIEIKAQNDYLNITTKLPIASTEPAMPTAPKESRKTQSILTQTIILKKARANDVIDQLAEILTGSQEAQQLSLHR